jgi:hypothetical protein
MICDVLLLAGFAEYEGILDFRQVWTAGGLISENSRTTCHTGFEGTLKMKVP